MAGANNSRQRSRDQRGIVTAELAMALPLLLVLTLGLVWLLTLATAQLRLQDAASQTARALARGDEPGAAVAIGRRVAPQGAAVEASTGGDQVGVVVTATINPPLRLLGGWGAVHLRAETEALREGEGEGGSGVGHWSSR